MNTKIHKETELGVDQTLFSESRKKTEPKNYFPRLNALRGIAIIMVLMQHYGWYYLAKYDFGRYGVDLFFVLSGFLITGILINSKGSIRLALKNFYGRRFLRIFPIYYATIFILLALNDSNVKNSIASLLTYTFNYYAIRNNTGITDISHMWSLSVEEQFYIVWPFLLLPFRKNKAASLTIVALIVAVSLVQLVYSPFMNKALNYIATFPRTYFLSVGGAAAIIFNKRPVKGNQWLDLLVLAISIVLIVIDAVWSEIILALTWVYFIAKSASPNSFTSIIEKIFSNKLLQRIGLVSYGIYVFHKPLAQYVFNPLYQYMYNKVNWVRIGKPWSYIFYHPYFLPMVLYPVLAYLFALASYSYFEKPLLKLKDKWFK